MYALITCNYKFLFLNAHHCTIHSKCAELALLFLNIPVAVATVGYFYNKLHTTGVYGGA